MVRRDSALPCLTSPASGWGGVRWESAGEARAAEGGIAGDRRMWICALLEPGESAGRQGAASK
jgi:hypothetical protein